MIPLVSICIPTYNRASMLREAVTSALAQDYANLEVVVSDNASTDDTSKVVNEFNDPRIKYFRNSVNIGVFQNFSKAAYKYARGKYAMLLADDDYLIDNSYITKAVDLFKKDRKVVLVFSNWRSSLGDRKYVDHIMQLPCIIDGKWVVLNYGTKLPNGVNLIVSIYTMLFKRELAMKIDAISASYLDGDVVMICKLSVHGYVGFVNTVSLVRRVHEGNVSQTCGYEEWLDNIFRKGIDIADYIKDKEFPSKSINKFKRRFLKTDLHSMIAKTVFEKLNNKTDSKPSLWRLIKKAYSQDPLLLTVFLRPRVITQIVLSLNPPLYSFFRKRYGSTFKNIKRL